VTSSAPVLSPRLSIRKPILSSSGVNISLGVVQFPSRERRRLSEEAGIDCVIADMHDSDETRIGMGWVQQDVERLRHYGGRDPEERRMFRLQPSIPIRTGDVGLLRPVCGKTSHCHFFDAEVVRGVKLHQPVSGGKIANVNFEMNEDLEQRCCRTLAAVDDSVTTRVPAA
jgi:hypothetical protein